MTPEQKARGLVDKAKVYRYQIHQYESDADALARLITKVLIEHGTAEYERSAFDTRTRLMLEYRQRECEAFERGMKEGLRAQGNEDEFVEIEIDDPESRMMVGGVRLPEDGLTTGPREIFTRKKKIKINKSDLRRDRISAREIKLPETKPIETGDQYQAGFNSCINEIKKLNGLEDEG